MDLKGSECLVFYTISTRSIPAQTTPEFVLILNTAEELTAEQAGKIVTAENYYLCSTEIPCGRQRI